MLCSSAISPAISLRASGVRVVPKLNSPQSYWLMQAWPMRHSALEFFFDDLAENLVVQGEIGVHLLELGVFFFEFLQFLKLANLETAVLPFPLIERGSGNIESPADFVRRHSGFKFVYAFDDFRFGMSQFFHGCSFATKGSILTQAELPFV